MIAEQTTPDGRRHMRKLIVTLLLFIIQVNILSPAALAKSKFSDLDVKQYAWAMDSVNFMIDKGIVNGYEDGTFKPDQSVTKAELGVMIFRLFSHLRSNNKLDTSLIVDLSKNHWAYNEIISVYSMPHLAAARYNEQEGTYRLQPDKLVNRWEAMLIIDNMFPSFPSEPKYLYTDVRMQPVYSRPVPSLQEKLLTISKMKDVEIKPLRSENERSDYNDVSSPYPS
jgi:hypothetical protein